MMASNECYSILVGPRMAVIRINDLARELSVKSKHILDVLPLVGVDDKGKPVDTRER